jgi:hypothetical protein
MLSTISPPKPGKLKRALKLRPIEWMPLLAGLLINLASTVWFIWRVLHSPAESFGSSIGDPGPFAATLGTPLLVRHIATPFCALLLCFAVVCWIVRVISIIREN